MWFVCDVTVRVVWEWQTTTANCHNEAHIHTMLAYICTYRHLVFNVMWIVLHNDLFRFDYIVVVDTLVQMWYVNCIHILHNYRDNSVDTCIIKCNGCLLRVSSKPEITAKRFQYCKYITTSFLIFFLAIFTYLRLG